MESFGHLSEIIQNDNKKFLTKTETIYDMIRVRIKVEITSMSRYDRKDQAVGCFEKFEVNLHLMEEQPKTFILYEPYRKMQPMQFIDTNIIGGKLLDLKKEVYFLSFDKSNPKIRPKMILKKIKYLPGVESYQVGQAVAFDEPLSEDKILELLPKIDVIVPPTWLVTEGNIRLGGGKFNWTNFIEKVKSSRKTNSKTQKVHIFALIFDVQAMQEDLPEKEKLITVDQVFCANDIYYPPTEENKNDNQKEGWANPLSGPIPGMSGPSAGGGGGMPDPNMLAGLGGNGPSLEEMEAMLMGMGSVRPSLRQCPTEAEGYSQNPTGGH